MLLVVAAKYQEKTEQLFAVILAKSRHEIWKRPAADRTFDLKQIFRFMQLQRLPLPGFRN